MEELFFDDLRKKDRYVGFRISEYERDELDDFCARNNLTITSFFRFAMRIVINSNYRDKLHEYNINRSVPKIRV